MQSCDNIVSMHEQLSQRMVESILKIKEAAAVKPSEKGVPGTRLGEAAPDVTLSPDYKKIHDQQNERFLNSPFGRFLTSKKFDKLLSKLADR